MQPKLPGKERDPLEEAAALFDPEVVAKLRAMREEEARSRQDRFKVVWKKAGGR